MTTTHKVRDTNGRRSTKFTIGRKTPVIIGQVAHYESEAKCEVFIGKISFHSYANKTNIQMKHFALSLAFTTRFKETRKWPNGETAIIIDPPINCIHLMIKIMVFITT